MFTSQLGSGKDRRRSHPQTALQAGSAPAKSPEPQGALMVSSVQVLQGLKEALSLHTVSITRVLAGSMSVPSPATLPQPAIDCPHCRVHRMKMSSLLIRLPDSLISCQKDPTTLSTLWKET